MKSKIFSKVILSGEHSVLRGGLAVVAPNKNHFLEYSFENSNEFKLNLDVNVKPYELLFLGLVESALAMSSSQKKDLKVKANVSSIVPLGEGLGGSAALCVFVGRLFSFANLLDEGSVFSFAHEIENVFHGQSSGLDVAGCMTDRIVLYQKGVKKIEELIPNLKGFSFIIHATGEKGETKDCIEKVLKLRKENKDLFDSLDDRMSEASVLIKSGLESTKVDNIISSFKETSEIFKQWGLLTKKAEHQMNELKKEGALATRLTGSGMGGCIISLWSKTRVPLKYKKDEFLEL